MKKALSLLLVGLLVLGMTGVVFAADITQIPDNKNFAPIEELAPDACADMFGDSYPYSVDYEWPEVKNGEIIKGTVVSSYDEEGSHCWSNGTNNASCAFDGDTQTFYDPYIGGSGEHTYSWCGLLLDEPYELTEVRICNRSGQEHRISGAAIQGSNDNGETWHNVVYVDPAIYGKSGLLTNDYHVFTPEPVQEYIDANLQYMDESKADFSVYWVGTGSYSLYRYVAIESEHGDCAEIELYGYPKAAYVGEEKTIVTADKSDQNNYLGTVDNTGIAAAITDGSIPGTVIGGGGSYSAGSNEYPSAYDGDGSTFFDPAGANWDCWNGILADGAYVLTEVRVMPRVDWYTRTEGAVIQGSNDGATWTDLYQFTADDILQEGDEQTYIVRTIDSSEAFNLFRYANQKNHGDCAEIVFIGTKGEAALGDVKWTPETYDYPNSGIAHDGKILKGELIGNETGWGDNADAGRAAAFDGNPNTFFDPLGTGDGWCGVKVADPTILDAVAILSRKDNGYRFEGARIDGSNDGENWTNLYTSPAAAASETEYTVITEFENNTGYTMFRYYNETQHGDVAEVELYGHAAYTYPNSGVQSSGTLLTGTLIGNEEGWGGNADAGRAAAFDGNPNTFFDPLGKGDGYCGVQVSDPMVLDTVAILSRQNADLLGRFNGAMIQGSNDGENWTTLFTGSGEGKLGEYTIVTEFENNTGYTMFRYYNETEHGDVAEVELYGHKYEAPTETPTETPTDTTTTTTDSGSTTTTTEKSGCGSFIGGGLIVMIAVIGSAWISRRK